MRYATIRDLRSYLQFYPIKIEGEELRGVIDGVNKTFYTKNKPLVDFDYDGLILDDVTVRVNNDKAVISELDVETGKIVLLEAPPDGAYVTVDYYWHPFGDNEIKQAVETAELDIDNQCGRSFEVKTVSERIYISFGNRFMVSYTPILSISRIRIEDLSGNITETLSSDDYVYQEDGLVILKKYYAGIVSPPWYLPSRFYVHIVYTGGYVDIPSIVKQATILLASYHLLSKISFMLTTEPEYQGKISVAFKRAEDIVKRLEFLKNEIDKIIVKLPKRVVVI